MDIDCTPEAPCEFISSTYRLLPGPQLGLRLGVHGLGIFGFEASVATARLGRQLETVIWMYPEPREDPGVSSFETSTSTSTFALRATLTPRLTSRFETTVGAGISMTLLGESQALIEDRSLVGASLAGRVGIPMPENSRLEFGVEYYAYAVDMMSHDTSTAQRDLVVSIGGSFALRR